MRERARRGDVETRRRGEWEMMAKDKRVVTQHLSYLIGPRVPRRRVALYRTG